MLDGLPFNEYNNWSLLSNSQESLFFFLIHISLAIFLYTGTIFFFELCGIKDEAYLVYQSHK